MAWCAANACCRTRFVHCCTATRRCQHLLMVVLCVLHASHALGHHRAILHGPHVQALPSVLAYTRARRVLAYVCTSTVLAPHAPVIVRARTCLLSRWLVSCVFGLSVWLHFFGAVILGPQVDDCSHALQHSSHMAWHPCLRPDSTPLIIRFAPRPAFAAQRQHIVCAAFLFACSVLRRSTALVVGAAQIDTAAGIR